MATEVRWARSPDGCALLVVEDPAGVENEPIPDAVTYARSSAAGVRVARLDSVWDVAPDRAWRRFAVGRAFVAHAGGADSIPDAAWAALARAAGRPERDVRAAAFAASGMAVAVAVARPAVWEPATGRPPAALPLLGGWRVRWAPDGDGLLVGAGPARAGDDEPARAWLRADPRSGRALGTAPGPPYAAPAAGWHEAPLLDVSTRVDLRAGRALPVAGGRVVGDAGRLSVVDAAGHVRAALGPGVPLGATADGRVVLAIAPRPGAPAEHEVRWRVVLYVVE
jgi:hypothetical protein